ncbi:MAG TPA: lytic murein transglycosylase [Aliidongia sp.]|nr:lytic murein transglycosylase [Aliidongia sp.]
MDRRHMLALLGGAGLVIARAGQAASDDFPTWLAAFKKEAIDQGIRRSTVENAFVGVQPSARVLELDRKQPETTITFQQYIDRAITQQRVDAARKRLEENRPLLTEIERRYNVQPRFIVALWGLETGFGAVVGDFSIITALTTLAYDGRRGDFFRTELIAALRILDQGRFQPSDLKGSWAGAMGQTQFMPSSFLKYAVDYNGNGRQDIWHDRADVLASIANYLSSVGWDGANGWGREVVLPAAFDPTLLGGHTLRSVDAWRSIGVEPAEGGALPHIDLEAGLVQPGGADGPTLMTYGNYRVIMKWNRSLYFASAVSYLADRIGS